MALALFAAILDCRPALAVEDANEASFNRVVLPFFRSYCTDCHSGDKPKAKFDLGPYTSLESVVRDHGHWKLVLDRLQSGEMPPEDEKQPSPAARKAIVTWIETLRRQEAERHAGDPGIVLARRLSNAEYDYTIRDLTGVDIRPTKEFPIDPANEAGFDNTGESLSLSPALLKKYLDAARHISEHVVLKPDGLEFAPHPVVTNTDRDRFCVKRIIDFYQRQETNLTAYFVAAWQFQYRTNLGAPSITLDQQATALGVSPKYLGTLLELLNGTDVNAGPIAALRREWRELPTSEKADAKEVRRKCEVLRDRVLQQRSRLSTEFPHLNGNEIHKGAQAIVLWRNRQYATHRRSLNRDALRAGNEGNGQTPSSHLSDIDGLLGLSADPVRSREEVAALEKFCSVFPDAFFISERGREYLKRDEKTLNMEKGRLLSAGLHSMLGYFRDDAPLGELILSEKEKAELDELWLELDVIASAPIRQHKSLVWFERTDSKFMRDEEFDFARAEDHDVVTEEKIKRLAEVYLNKALRTGVDEIVADAIRDHFRIINESIRTVERVRSAAEPRHLRDVLVFAKRAYRRPITKSEQTDLLAFYDSLRKEEKASHEDAIRDLVVSVLMSPHFWYRVDLPAQETAVHPLSNNALASRLSYLLWSSMPDAKLLAVAARGELQQADVLLAQSRRMISDPRIRGLAVEFGGNWLDFRHFENHNSVDRGRFPSFNDQLRRAMFEEPVQFFIDLAQENRSVLEFLFAGHTMVNATLARHYGIARSDLTEDRWVRVNDMGVRQRGGLLPMAVFQTYNAPGLRTSPVKRGYWVVRRLLGEQIPPPPPGVPELPADEGLGDLTLRERLARHREDRNCAGCHDRFDSIGLAFEGFGPIGELRTLDLGNRPVDTHAVFPDGSEGDGLVGLKSYLKAQRQDDFLENLCRKLFSYALGRNLILSDDPTIATMQSELRKNHFRFGSLIETIVTSRQFRNQRGRINLTQRKP